MVPATPHLLCPERRVYCPHQGRPAEIRMPWRTRLVLVHDVTEAHVPIDVCKANGAPSPWMPKRTRIRTERWKARLRFTHGEHEPKFEPRGERKDGIRPVR